MSDKPLTNHCLVDTRRPKPLLGQGSETYDENDETKMSGWMICDFRSFSTVFQSYQDDERLKIKSCVQWNPFYG